MSELQEYFGERILQAVGHPAPWPRGNTNPQSSPSLLYVLQAHPRVTSPWKPSQIHPSPAWVRHSSGLPQPWFCPW